MQPLDNVTVLDFTQVIAGPLSTRMLGNLGADVVKIEPPEGESSRGDLEGAYFSSYNTSKRGIVLDLKSEEGSEAIQKGAEEADVIVESFRPGVMAKFDLDYETVREYNEDVVYCSISGYGQTGPYSDRPAYDPIIQAVTGIMETMGYQDRPPVRMKTPMLDMTTAWSAAFGIVMALWQRDNTAEGDYIDVSLYENGISLMSCWIAQYDSTGEIPQRSGRKGTDWFAPTSVCQADGGDIYLLAPNQKIFERLCRSIDREDLLSDERFAEREDRAKHHDELINELEAAFDDRPYLELAEYLNEEGIPAGPVRDIGQIVDNDPQVAARDMIIETDNLTTGEQTKIAQLPLRFRNLDLTNESPPELGEDTESVLAEWGVTEKTRRAILDD
jgi:crotonobetainyl-CoA:carnitine CoA-transferase CaiB-like acyl-CoA transferase